MKSQLALAATAALFSPVAALTLISGAALAQESQTASMTVPYSCSVSPVTETLVATGTTASATGTNAYNQNSATIYSLSALSIFGPGGANPVNLTGTISLYPAADLNEATLVTNSSTAATADGAATAGTLSQNGTTQFTLTTTDPAFEAGSYSISATLSCAADLGGEP